MRATRRRFPKAKTIVLVAKLAAKLLPADTRPVASWHESERGHPALRLSASAGGVKWVLDIYSERFMCAHIDDRFPEVCSSVPSAVLYFRRMLGSKTHA